MPSCVVKWCKSNSRVHSKCTGISFHKFPQNVFRREQWAQAVRLERQEKEWQPNNYSYVCSIHFQDHDFYLSKTGCQMVKKTAIPFCTMVNAPISSNMTLSVVSGADPERTTFGIPEETTLVQKDIVKKEHLTLQDEATLPVTKFSDDVPAPSCSLTYEKSLKRKLEDSPNRKWDFYMHASLLEIEIKPNIFANSMDSMKPSSDPISVPTSGIESVFNSPRKIKLNKELTKETILAEKRLCKIKKMQHINKRLLKKNITMKDITAVLKNNGLRETYLHTALSGFAGDMISSLEKKEKKKGRSIIRFTQSIKKFALTLNYYSPTGYKYVRNQLLSCLPHPSTISKWYQAIDGKPGFTKEAFRALKSKYSQSHKKLACLMVDEMAIRQQKIFNGTNVDGLVTYGPPEEIATQVYVLMLVSLNDSFKLPLGFFFVNGFSAEQRRNIIIMCLERCHEVGAEVVSLTFDGCASNLAAAKLLGCNFDDSANLKTYFQHPVTKKPIVVILDPCHMVKLIRNTLETKKTLIDQNGGKVQWKYIQNLKNDQDNIGLHFGNKITERHLQFYNNIMNVKLAQTLSSNVATALKLCSRELNLPEFCNADATISFIETIDNLFEILNTRSLYDRGFKKSMIERKDELFEFLDRTYTYLRHLKIDVQSKKTLKNKGEKITTFITTQKYLIDTQYKTGFLGLLVCISSLKLLYTEIIEKQQILKFILPYKFSQDHLELFFGVIRNHGRCKNTPNARQFMCIYKKNLLNLELRSKLTGNCIPLDDIPILNCSSVINETTPGFRHELQENVIKDNYDTEMGNCMVLSNMLDVNRQLPETVEQIIGYIGGFVTKKLHTKIQCYSCTNLLLATEKLYFHKLISLKDFGGLAYPSVIVFKICLRSETLLRQLISLKGISLSRAHNLPVMVNQCFTKIIEKNDVLIPFQESHAIDSNHDIMLLKAIIEEFIKVRLHYISRKESLLNFARQKLNKLIIFRSN